MRRLWLLTAAVILVVAGCGRRNGDSLDPPGGLDTDWPPRTQPSSSVATSLEVVIGTDPGTESDLTDPDRPPPSYIPTSAWVTSKPTKPHGGGGGSADSTPDATDSPDTTDPADTDPPPTDPPGGPTTVPIGAGGSNWKTGTLASDPQVTADDGECEPFFTALDDAPYDVSECGSWAGAEGTLTWTLTRGASGRLRAIVWEQADEGDWSPANRLEEPKPGGAWDGVIVRTADVDGDGIDELLAGTRDTNEDAGLTLDILDITSHKPVVTAHLEGVSHGRGVLTPDGLVLYVAEPGAPLCCPISYASYLITFTKSGYSAVLQDGGIDPADVPSADL